MDTKGDTNCVAGASIGIKDAEAAIRALQKGGCST